MEPFVLRGSHLTAQAASAMSLGDIYSCFESLGNNCEFGIVQRRTGFDPPGLFRNVGFDDVEQIIRAIESDFEGMFIEGAYDFTLCPGWPDWRLNCRKFGFGFHTNLPISVVENTAEWKKATAKTTKTFRFLKSKIQQDLAQAEKVFVFRSLQELPNATAARLLAAIQVHGDGALLAVRVDQSAPSGSLEFLDRCLMIGTVHRLSNENPPIIDFDAWEKMARLIMQSPAKIWTRRPTMNPTPLKAPVLPDYGKENLSGVVTHYVEEGAPRKQVLALDLNGLQPSSTITISGLVCFLGEPACANIDLVLIGYRSEKFVKPNLKLMDCWQPISVTARIPANSTHAVISMAVDVEFETMFCSANWTVRIHDP